jgi:serine/threonine protein kinase
MAYHKKSGQKVAVKMMAKASMKIVEAHQTRREIEVMKMGKHPNVVRLIDVFEDAENFYLVLEYMGGGDLFDYLKSRSFKL